VRPTASARRWPSNWRGRIVLVSRSADKLAALKEELTAKYSTVEVRTEAVDFSCLTEQRRLEQ